MTTSPKHLQEAIYELSVAKRIPDAALLDQVVSRHPKYASELTAFAIDLALDTLLYGDDDVDGVASASTVSPTASRVISRFQNELFAVREGGAKSLPPQAAKSPAENPFSSLDRKGFRALATKVNANTVFLTKLRDRHVDPATIPEAFSGELAKHMDVPLELLTAHFQAPPGRLATSQFFRADDKPETKSRQPFVDAVRNSGLSPAQQERLMKYVT